MIDKVKFLQPHYLYNMLQDFRHLLIFDLREDFEECYIRDSFNVYEKTTNDEIVQIIEKAEKKGAEKQKKYPQLKKIRRYFFIGSKKIEPSESKVKNILQILTKFESKQDKIYALNQGFDAFYKAYPFMCLVQAQFAKLKQEGKEKQMQKLLIYPYSKFPAQIIIDKLFLGDIYASNSQKHLEDLKIKSLIDFVQYKEDEIVPTFKSQKYNYLNFAMNKDVPVNLDFDLINAEIDKKMSQGRVLLYCKDGESISSAFAISYLMYKVGLDINMATLKVCQAISRTDIAKWIYTQLLVYKPKK